MPCARLLCFCLWPTDLSQAINYGRHMASDDIEKLLAEINGLSGQENAPTPATKPAQASSTSGRFPFAVASAVVVGGSGAVFGLLFPFFSIVSTGMTAAGAAFVTALVAGPPRWFSS